MTSGPDHDRTALLGELVDEMERLSEIDRSGWDVIRWMRLVGLNADDMRSMKRGDYRGHFLLIAANALCAVESIDRQARTALESNAPGWRQVGVDGDDPIYSTAQVRDDVEPEQGDLAPRGTSDDPPDAFRR
jgi:hypothetical protein